MVETRYTRGELHQETARVRWQELESHFARGVVIRVAAELDLVEVATCFANDDKAMAERWMASGKIEQLGTQTAKDWSERDPVLWGVVVAPWVLVQERAA